MRMETDSVLARCRKSFACKWQPEQTENVANVPLLDLILELISLTYIFYFLNGAN